MTSRTRLCARGDGFDRAIDGIRLIVAGFLAASVFMIGLERPRLFGVLDPAVTFYSVSTGASGGGKSFEGKLGLDIFAGGRSCCVTQRRRHWS